MVEIISRELILVIDSADDRFKHSVHSVLVVFHDIHHAVHNDYLRLFTECHRCDYFVI